MTKLELFKKACDSGAKTAGKNTQYTISSDATNIYLAIQGSCDADDWKFNFSFWLKPIFSLWKKPYKRMNTLWFAHWGFATAWKLAKDQIVADVIAVLENKQLVILGYSHGAALATMAHEYFQFNGYNPTSYVFGCPRVLWLPSKTIRSRFLDLTMINRRGDLVAHVPPVLFGYRHIAKPELVGKPALIWWKRHLISEYTVELD
jgi:hypothetical protein